MSAKKGERFGIFQVDLDGIIYCIAQDDNADCIYPQKVGSKLFYIERVLEEYCDSSNSVSYKIVEKDYPVVNSQIAFESFDDDKFEKVLHLMDDSYCCNKVKYTDRLNKNYILDFKQYPLAFLKMISEDEGFLLEHPDKIDRHDKTLQLSCYHIKKDSEEWIYTKLFSFSIPSYLLLDSDGSCLYESVLPLLPRYKDNLIYYVDCSRNNKLNLELFVYDLENKQIEKKSLHTVDQNSFFSPVFVGEKVFYGGEIASAASSPISMWINKEGLVCFDLPEF